MQVGHLARGEPDRVRHLDEIGAVVDHADLVRPGRRLVEREGLDRGESRQQIVLLARAHEVGDHSLVARDGLEDAGDPRDRSRERAGLLGALARQRDGFFPERDHAAREHAAG